jgi:hypothetical protein
MIEKKDDNKENKKISAKSSGNNGVAVQPLPETSNGGPMPMKNGMLTDDIIMQNRQKLAMKIHSPGNKKPKT